MAPGPSQPDPTTVHTRSGPHRSRSHRFGPLAALALAVLVAGCSTGDDEADATRSTTAPSGTAAVTYDPGEPELPDDGPAVPSPGCDTGGTPPGELIEQRHELPGILDPDGTARWYLLTAPAAVEPLPLVVDFHGLTEGAVIHALMSEMGGLGLEEGFVTAFPNGTGRPVGWQASVDDEAESPDLPYVDALLEDIFATRCIDTSRVYATGLSNGAMMTSMLACTRADRFAAFAPVAGLTTWAACEPSRPAPILAFHGTADPILLFNGGVGDLGIITGGAPPGSAEQDRPEVDLDGDGYPATARRWAEANGCDPEPVDEDLTAEILIRTWTCPPGAPVQFVIIEGGGHSWPGSEFSKSIEDIVGPTTDDIHASEAMWEFFSRHQLPT